MTRVAALGWYGVARRAVATACLVAAAGAALPAAAAFINIQPIKICDDAGASCANDGEELFLAATNKIWAQAGLTFNYLPFTTTNSSVYLNLDDQDEVNSLFSDAPGAAGNPLTISMWFVNSHFDAFGEVDTLGGNKIVIDEVIFSLNRLDTIAHEVGHLLGLTHDDAGVEVDYLMRSGGDRITPSVLGDITPDGAALDKLTNGQIATALADPKVSVVPEPGTYALALAGFGVLGFMARRRSRA
jgi:hypothetical protein